jgi:hypothetical protein
MLIIDKFRRRESKDRPLCLRGDRVDTEDADSRKIIDFESARQAFERDDATNRYGKQFNRPFFNDLKTDRSAGVAESVVTIVLVLVIGLSLLLGMLWGF